ncbi:hypothetical protein CR513_55049, partial [Mucuna pruriens]
MKSMQDNDVWDLVELPESGNIERYKARLVAKGFTQNEGIDYKETFSLVSSKDSLRTVMTVVAHFDLELHQMDVKIAFLNGDIDEMIYMASRQWYHKFHQVITSYGFEANVVDDCVYHKLRRSKYIFMVLYVDDVLFASSDTSLLNKAKRFLTKNFEMKDLEEASFVLGIQILRDRSQGILKLSQENYISKVLYRFDMKDSKPRDTLIVKGDKFSLNSGESNECSSLYLPQHCLCGGSFRQHWKVVKRVICCLKRTK